MHDPLIRSPLLAPTHDRQQRVLILLFHRRLLARILIKIPRKKLIIRMAWLVTNRAAECEICIGGTVLAGKILVFAGACPCVAVAVAVAVGMSVTGQIVVIVIIGVTFP